PFTMKYSALAFSFTWVGNPAPPAPATPADWINSKNSMASPLSFYQIFFDFLIVYNPHHGSVYGNIHASGSPSGGAASYIDYLFSHSCADNIRRYNGILYGRVIQQI